MEISSITQYLIEKISDNNFISAYSNTNIQETIQFLATKGEDWYFPPHNNVPDGFQRRRKTFKEFEEEISNGLEVILFTDFKKRNIGYCSFKQRQCNFKQRIYNGMYIDRLVLAPHVASSGIGTEIIYLFTTLADSNLEIEALSATVNPYNTRSQNALYKNNFWIYRITESNIPSAKRFDCIYLSNWKDTIDFTHQKSFQVNELHFLEWMLKNSWLGNGFTFLPKGINQDFTGNLNKNARVRLLKFKG